MHAASGRTATVKSNVALAKRLRVISTSARIALAEHTRIRIQPMFRALPVPPAPTLLVQAHLLASPVPPTNTLLQAHILAALVLPDPTLLQARLIARLVDKQIQ